MIAPPRARPGFTLIELLVVLAIVAMLATLARPMFAAAVPGAKLRGEVLELARTLRHSRNQAVGTGARIDVVFDPANSQYTPGTAGSIELSRRSVMQATALGAEFPRDPAEYRLEFHPDGSSSGASIEIRNGSAGYNVDVDWLTSRVRVTETKRER